MGAVVAVIVWQLDLQLPVQSVHITTRSRRGVQHYVIKFVSDLRQVSGFLRVSSTNKTDRHNIAEILLKVALNTIKQTNKQTNKQTSKHKHIYLMQGGVNIITNQYIASWCNKTQGLLNFASVEANLVDGYVTPAVSSILFKTIGSLYRATIIHKTMYA